MWLLETYDNRNFSRVHPLIDDHLIDVGSINNDNDNLELSKSHSFIDEYIDTDNIKKKLKNNNKNKNEK